MTIQKKTIYQKLLSVQEQVGVVSKESENPFYKSKYADINKYLEVVKPILSKNGLILLQPIEYKNGKNILTTRIYDEDGNRIKSEMELPVNPDPQKQGAVITYFRRYAIQSLLALQAEDDDANSTVETPTIQYGDKECPICHTRHNGKYPKCINCYKSGAKKIETLPSEEEDENNPFNS